ncbi:MAG: UDP-N-acetylmuramoylalanyl-D-glutamyl-2, 6-diaminopimelate--D-alanyl-D-alanine ligase, partial [Verrucomicrobia bacterium]|nr:UDP-N-acetylmuramoylalanyl-D-glutamyl-2, 6-diaminopimelate--D-alanyl-D-alanine ligase [Verrucomicrobiota bacterium]
FDAMSVPGSKWLVLGDMLELGVHAEPEHLALGAAVASGSWRGLVVVGKHSETIAEGARDQGFAKDRIWCCERNAEVIALLKREMNPGDAVLLKASRGVALEEVVCGMGS